MAKVTKKDVEKAEGKSVEIPTEKTNENSSMNFGSIITFLGIVGVIIGCVSLYFYAVANNWISPLARVGVGITIAVLMFVTGYMLNEKNKIWSFLVIGGSITIGFLAVGIGVLNYKVLNESVGFAILTIFIAIAGMLSVKFSSRIIAYYTIVGGYLVPIVTNVSSNLEFTMLYILLLSVALMFLSSKFNWSDLRFFSFLLIYLSFLLPQGTRLITNTNLFILLAFITLIFLIYNISSLFFAFNKNQEISNIDIVTLNLNSLFNIFYLNLVLIEHLRLLTYTDFGLILVAYSIFYILEYLFFKNFFEVKKVPTSIFFSFISSFLLTLNVGFMLFFAEFNFDILFLFFVIQWFIFTYMSSLKENEENVVLFQVVSYLFLFLATMWYFFVIRFESGVLSATVMMLIFTLIPIGSFYLRRYVIESKFVGLIFLLSMYCFLYSLSKYLLFFIPSQNFFNISLSVLWLAFTLFALITLSDNKDAKSFLTILLIAVIIKIAFIDLFMLRGVYRIVGFIVLGILMLIGGYFMNSHNIISNPNK